ncbi:MAG TPA: prolyl oligopeptidase family serine peptidase, partial [Edaphobacter sp.]
MMKYALACLTTLLCLTTSLAYSQSFTLEQALSAPFASELVAGPKPGTAAWMENLQGWRNLWVAIRDTSGKFTAKQLTAYNEDDGQEMYDVAWTPDSAQILYVRGGDSEFRGRPDPNPALATEGVSQSIFIIPVAGGEPRKLAEGHSPAVSPHGDQVAFLSHAQVWTAGLAPDAGKAKQMFHARGDISSIVWAPDGHALAFATDRGDHGFIGVYDLASKTLRYLDPGTATDSQPAWSPDSKQIAFIREPGQPEGAPFNRRTALPWSIHVADAATGGGHAIWTASPGRGSAFREIHGTQLMWTGDNLLVFPWEADGWSHLYSIPAIDRCLSTGPERDVARCRGVKVGAKPQLLTSGEFEVEDARLASDHKTVLYASNQQDIDRRHIWSVPASGGTPRSLTTGTGIEVSPVDTTQGIIILRSDLHAPLRPALIGPQGAPTDLAPELIPSTYPGDKFVTPEQVLFPAADGLQIHGQLFLPPNAHDGKRHPALVFFHGGSRRQMLLGFHPMQYYSNAYAMNQYLASQGYIVLSVNYRSGIGYGLDFREAMHYGRDGASEFNDILGAGHYLQSRTDVDPARIGAWGGSYGGFMTALALARASDIFAAGVDMHGVHQWQRPASWHPSHDPAADERTLKTAWESSPMAYISTWRSPVLLIQGDDDRNVPFSQTVSLSRELSKQGVEYEELIFPDEIHGFLLHRS